jgi:DNA-binding XRE family transcriptional regulator
MQHLFEKVSHQVLTFYFFYDIIRYVIRNFEKEVRNLVLADKLLNVMTEKGHTREDLAKILGISQKCLKNKIEYGRWGAADIEKLVSAWKIEQPESIFFAQ